MLQLPRRKEVNHGEKAVVRYGIEFSVPVALAEN
jgi:hypothetical protein